MHFRKVNTLKKSKEIFVIESSPEKMVVAVMALKKKINEHLKDGGRVKIIHTDGSPPQELLQDFTFVKWKE